MSIISAKPIRGKRHLTTLEQDDSRAVRSKIHQTLKSLQLNEIPQDALTPLRRICAAANYVNPEQSWTAHGLLNYINQNCPNVGKDPICDQLRNDLNTLSKLDSMSFYNDVILPCQKLQLTKYGSFSNF